MKKIRRIFALFLVYTIMQSSLSAMNLENPAIVEMPEQGLFISPNAFLGFKAGYGFDRAKEITFTAKEDAKDLKHFSYLSHEGSLTCNLNNYVEIYGAFGKFSKSSFRLDGQSFASDGNWLGKIGGRALIIFWGNTSLALDAKFLKSGALSFSLENTNEEKFSSEFNAWQAGIGITRKFSWVAPYIGGAYAKYQLCFNDREEYMNHDHFIGVVGMSLFNQNAIVMNAEMRFFAEFGLGATIQMRF